VIHPIRNIRTHRITIELLFIPNYHHWSGTISLWLLLSLLTEMLSTSLNSRRLHTLHRLQIISIATPFPATKLTFAIATPAKYGSLLNPSQLRPATGIFPNGPATGPSWTCTPRALDSVPVYVRREKGVGECNMPNALPRAYIKDVSHVLPVVMPAGKAVTWRAYRTLSSDYQPESKYLTTPSSFPSFLFHPFQSQYLTI
jgi:hypothetical protein